MKDKFINFRASEKEKKQLAILAKKAKMSQAEFIRHAVFNKEIIVNDGLKPLQTELKRIGNNLNQLTTRSNMGHFSVIDLQETKDELGRIHERLFELCATKDEQARPEIEHINEADAPIQCISTEDEMPKQDSASQNQTEQNTLSEHKPKLGERRNNSIFSNTFDRNRGD